MVDMRTDRRQRWRWWGVLAVGLLVAGDGAHAHQQVPRSLINNVERVPLPPSLQGDDAAAERFLFGLGLFFEETFDGNGRTCGTCHPAANNFTIDRAFIRRLSRRDPLFVAEFFPGLEGLENPRLMRNFGLILENLDGFDKDPVFRGVPHTLGLSVSIKPVGPNVDAAGLVNATGWSGDGAPVDTVGGFGNGSLGAFALGAVAQHFPDELPRKPPCIKGAPDAGCSFRMPTSGELEALLTFQLGLGRTEDIEIEDLEFSDEDVNNGLALFLESPTTRGDETPADPTDDTRSCNGCHGNAGALSGDGRNRNFDTGTRLSPNAPACRDASAQGDGGFGPDPEFTETIQCANGPRTVTFRGDRTMNTPSLIEAADTAPFFHNNSAETLEDAVRFYTSDIFEASAAGIAGGGAFDLDDDQIRDVANFLGALNVFENIRIATVYVDAVSQAGGQSAADVRRALQLAAEELDDAVNVFREMGEFTVGIRTDLMRARAEMRSAAGRGDVNRAQDAIGLAAGAEKAMPGEGNKAEPEVGLRFGNGRLRGIIERALNRRVSVLRSIRTTVVSGRGRP